MYQMAQSVAAPEIVSSKLPVSREFIGYHLSEGITLY